MPVSKVEKAAAATSVLAIDLDEVVKLPDVSAPSAEASVAATGPNASTPDDNPYMPTNETGAVAFKVAHPTWDGKGVTIGILDSGIDLAHPALQQTTTGERKIVDWFTATDPVTEGQLVAGGDATWLRDGQERPARPFRHRRTGARPGRCRPAPSSSAASTRPAPTWPAARSAATSTATATRPTGSAFSTTRRPTTSGSTPTMTRTSPTTRRCGPTARSHQVGTFGTDNPATQVVEAMPFTVDFREDQESCTVRPGTGLPDKIDFVDIGIVSAAHGSHVAGITAANNMFGGQMDGAAPGAKLVSARACSFGPGCTAAALTDGMAELAANRGVDIINMSIGGLPALNDGNNAARRALQPDHRRRCADRDLGRQQRQRAQHDRRPVGRHRRGQCRRLDLRGDLDGQLRLGRGLQR